MLEQPSRKARRHEGVPEPSRLRCKIELTEVFLIAARVACPCFCCRRGSSPRHPLEPFPPAAEERGNSNAPRHGRAASFLCGLGPVSCWVTARGTSGISRREP